jgi:hypothetical protein
LNGFFYIFESLKTLFWQDPMAQTIGFVALILGVSAFLHRDDQKLRYYLTAFTFLMAIHFFMLGLWTAAIMVLLGTTLNYVSSLTSNVWVMLIFLLMAWLMAIPNSSEWVHLLPVIGVTLSTWAVFKEKGLRMRLLMSMGTVCWFSHNYLVGSIGGLIIEGIFLIVNGRIMFKLLKDQQSQKSTL